MKAAAIFLLAMTVPPPVAIGGLAGVFNTGPSLEEAANGASLNIRFHPCTDDETLVCATVLETVEPGGPSGKTVLPNGDPVIGFVFIRDLKPRGGGKWRDGKIVVIDESLIKGKMIWYGVKIDDRFDGTLEATGCLAFLCPRRMTWTTVEPVAGAKH